jgi:hypothetical protein
MFAPSSILATEFRAAAPVTSGSHYLLAVSLLGGADGPVTLESFPKIPNEAKPPARTKLAVITPHFGTATPAVDSANTKPAMELTNPDRVVFQDRISFLLCPGPR